MLLLLFGFLICHLSRSLQEGEGLEKHVRKRVTIAVQLVIRPRVLFLDEPVSAHRESARAWICS